MTIGGRRDASPGSASAFGAGAQTTATQGASGSPGTSPASSGTTRADAGTGAPTGQPQGASSLLPALTVPTGGGAIRGIGEKFSVNAATGTASLGVPLAVSPGRAGFGPAVELSYDSGSGNGPFGLGFRLSVPTISRKTDHGLPRYYDEDESDEYMLSGAEDLVPTRNPDGTLLELTRTLDGIDYRVRRYRPRVEGLFANIERWIQPTTRDAHWRVTTRDNVTNVYGLDSEARIVDPDDSRRVFSWLLEETRDDKGNVVRYEYKAEDGLGVDPTKPSERSRFDYSSGTPAFLATAQRYLKRVHYCNRTPSVPAPGVATDEADFLMELAFDYGEHTPMPSTISEPGALASFPTPDDAVNDWIVRQDPLSTYRAGFEVRTYRLCRRVLMFHKFEATPLLVKSTDFTYEPGPAFTYLTGITQAGYLNDASTGNTPFRDVLPTLRLDYRRPVLNDVLSVLPKESLEGLEGGVDGARKQWVDLDGEGIPGVLIDSDYAWYYKSNRGSAKLDAPRVLSSMPSPAMLADGVQQLEDIAGDGQLDLVSYESPLAGYFTRTAEGTFQALRNFRDLPNIDFQDPNLRFLDADGDGLPDILISEAQAFVLYRSKGKEGFAAAERVVHPSDDSQGPAVVFADPEQTIQLADMAGDGLVDIVRIRNGEVSYWPNLGYGRFGKKVTLEQSPVFDTPDKFDARRIRFGDVDGSGTSDIFYLGSSSTTLYRNESGNRLAAGEAITSLPPVDNIAALSITDLLGTGTATLVWSTPLPGAASLFYVDLMGGKKPHLLEKVENNLGAETAITYAPSTKFYLEDKAADRPWLTRLAFPVHVVEKMERFDHISKSRLVSTYRYAHGFFDGVEREFRGFARVEQRDAEEFTASTETELFQAPVKTVTWFHTGAWLEKERLESALALEYFPPGPKTAADLALLVKDTHFEPDTLGTPLTIQDEREAARALRGSMLRQEIYAEDADITGDVNKALRPYLVTEQSFAVRRLQSSAVGLHGVFLTFLRESRAIHTERNPDDPRIGHDFVLDVDPYGNVTRRASIAYARQSIPASPPDLSEQGKTWATLTEALFANRPSPETPTNIDEDQRWHRIGVEYETRVSELTGLPSLPTGARIYAFETIDGAIETLLTNLNATNDLLFEDESLATTFLRRRTIDRRQQLFYDSTTLTTTQSPLGLGVIDSLALPYETYELALTTGLVTYLADESSLLTGVATSPSALATILLNEGKYVQRDEHYWAPSGRVVFGATQFYLPVEATNPFLDPAVPTERYFAEYDDFSLIVTKTRDPLGNTAAAENDYRVLAPRLLTDPNLNRTEAAFDALGMVVKTAVMGKTAEAVGDNLDNPTTELQYDLLRWQHQQRPAFVHTIAREVHVEDNATTPFQHSFTYFDGFERAVMQKIQAEPGEVPGVAGTVDPRWVGSGRTVFNNKGNPVKQYEPFFSATNDFEDEADIVETGVTPIIHYDPRDRIIRVEFPSGVESRADFDAWQRTDFDPNDTVLTSAWYATRGSPDPTDPEPTDPESRAAWLTAQHADTPTVTHLDSLGRTFLSVSHNRTNGIDTFHATRHALDIEAHVLEIMDAREIVTAIQVFDVLGRRLAIASPDRGARLDVADAANKPLRSYNSRQHSRRYEYDALQRPIRIRLAIVSGTEELVELTVYGEAHQQAQSRNLRGQPYQIYDGAGALTNARYDFKGNAIEGRRRLARTYRETPDWSSLAPFSTPESIEQAAEPLLESDVFLIRSTFDAINRATTRTAHDGSILHFEYNEAGLLERVDLSLGGGAPQPVILDIEYNARGQRTRYLFANPNSSAASYQTAYSYDVFTFQLARVLTTTSGNNDLLQDLRYFYDPIGNVVELHDRADPALVFGVAPVSGDNRYQYDALYRLVRATGREHPGQQGFSTQPGPFEHAPSTLPHPNDQQALLRYLETYAYDLVGNVERMAHSTFLDENGPAGPTWTQWTRRYEYATSSNRLLRTSLPGDAEGDFSETYDYDAHGSMTRMPHLTELEADWEERLRRVNKQGGGEVFMAYDALGGRIRKVWEHSGIVEERVYLGGSEVFRRRAAVDGSPWEFERTTLHVSDDGRRVAMVETKVLENGIPLPAPDVRWRFQLDNHIGSTTYELDHAANVISYEEYHPHGSTAFHASAASAGVSAKRYRYSGKERDEETGLYYYGARYYASWLGRWTSTDPSEFADGVNLYAYVQGNPINLVDPDGSLSWGAILGIAAAVVVGTVVTVATAGLAGPLVGTVAAGIIGGVVGGAAGGAAGQIVEDVAEGKKLELGKIAKAAGIGALAGGVFSGLGAAIVRGAATQTGRALLARVATSGVGQSVGRIATRAASTAVARGARRVGTALKERVQVPSEKAGEALGEKLGGRFAQRAAEHRAQRQLGEQVSADIAKEVASTPSGDPTKGKAHAGFGGKLDGKEQAAVTRSGSEGGTTGAGAIREPRAQAGGPPGKVLAPAPPPEVGPKAYDIKFPRQRDGERKLTQYIESVTTPSSTGSVVLGASKPMCWSCVGSILQTEANRPGINILRLSPSIDFPGAGVGGAVAPSLVEPGPAPVQPTPTIPIFRHDF